MPARQLIDLAVQKPESTQLREALRASVPAANLKAGTVALSDHGQGLFSVETSATPALFIDGAHASGMKQISSSPLWFAVVPLKTGRGHSFHYLLDRKKFGGKADVPSFGTDSYTKPGVPHGKLSEKTVFTSKIYDGMQSGYWVYTPAHYDPATPAALMVLDDGQQYINRDSSSIRLVEVIDNLTYEKKLPVIVSVFTMPGIATMPEGTPFYQAVHKAAKADTQAAHTSALRGVEYETLFGQYARFLNDELLTEVQSKYNIRKDPTAAPFPVCRVAPGSNPSNQPEATGSPAFATAATSILSRFATSPGRIFACGFRTDATMPRTPMAASRCKISRWPTR